jgi:mono/diheme cytochrome c family protein
VKSLAILPLLAGAAAPLLGQQVDSTRSTRAGVYMASQAERGSEVYANVCKTCHNTAFHTSPAFVAKWQGHPLEELYSYVRNAMPKSDPGSLTEGQYILVLAYLLKLNGMPAGAEELSGDSLALARIRIDFKPTEPF